MSSCWLVSPLTRLVDCEVKATKRPSAEIAGLELCQSPCSPAVETLTRSILAGSAHAGAAAPVNASSPAAAARQGVVLRMGALS